MTVLVTGANGFLGRRVVRAAALAGHDVRALVRPGTEPAAELVETPGTEIVRGDLRAAGPWCEVAAQADAVVHLASATSGDLAAQVAGSVRATEQLLAALDPAVVRRFVHISSFSVYDLGALTAGSVVDESTALEADPIDRDAYTATKLFQEGLVRDAFASHPERLVVLRPGMVYGPGHDWGWGTALTLGTRLGVVVAPRATMRLVYVDNCADAAVAALGAPDAGGATIDIVDDDLPTHAQFLRLGRRAGGTDRIGLRVPWPAAAGLGRLAATVDRHWFAGRARLPELLASARLAARWRPLRYDNSRAHEVLGWEPRVDLAEGVRRTVAEAPR
jgi:nucleoside-diphosphate-sugar epimerase